MNGKQSNTNNKTSYQRRARPTSTLHV